MRFGILILILCVDMITAQQPRPLRETKSRWGRGEHQGSAQLPSGSAVWLFPISVSVFSSAE